MAHTSPFPAAQLGSCLGAQPPPPAELEGAHAAVQTSTAPVQRAGTWASFQNADSDSGGARWEVVGQGF